MSDSDSEYSDTLSIDTAVNNLTDEMNTYFEWRDATIQRLDVMAGMIDELQIRVGALETDRDSLRGRIHLLEHRRGLEPGAGGGKRRRRKKKTRKKRGGLDSFPIGMLDQLSQDTVYNNPYKDDLIRRLNHIWNILGEEEGGQAAFKDLIRRNPNSFYQLIIHFIHQAEAEHHGGRRKKKTRKKRRRKKRTKRRRL